MSIPIIAILVGGVLGLYGIYTEHQKNMRKADLDSGDSGRKLNEIQMQVDALKQQNQAFKKRIEHLEAIVVDADLKLQTGIQDDYSLRSEEKKEGRNRDIEF